MAHLFRRPTRGLAGLLAFGLALAALARPAVAQSPAPAAADSCISCHKGAGEERLSRPAAQFTGTDVHRENGFGCTDCHGGDATASAEDAAHAASRGFRGRPSGQAIVATCSRCHSDAALMRRYSPRQHVDQAAEYATSEHGKRLAAGDTRVATCASCHAAHGIRTARDARSPVYPTAVAATCATCHANPAHMQGYTSSAGTPLPTTQLADYQKSVHFEALTRAGDLSAPTCNDCHGNHGAAPPGVGTVATVCGTCHAVFAQRFEKSVHREIFDKGCAECHGNHAVLKPDDTLLGTEAGAICGTCHSGADDTGVRAAQAMRAGLEDLKGRLSRTAAIIAQLKNAGMEVSAQELALGEVRSRLTLARTEMHTSSMEAVAPVLKEGVDLVTGIDAAAQQKSAELRFRRRGLAVSFVAILLFTIGLALKIRQIDRRQAAHGPGHDVAH